MLRSKGAVSPMLAARRAPPSFARQVSNPPNPALRLLLACTARPPVPQLPRHYRSRDSVAADAASGSAASPGSPDGNGSFGPVLNAIQPFVQPLLFTLTVLLSFQFSGAGQGLVEKLISVSIKWLSQISVANVLVKVVAVIVGGLPFILLFGFIYNQMTGMPLKESFLKFYALVNRMPGMSVLNEKSLPAFVFVNIIYYWGQFSFAIFLGVVSAEVKTVFTNFKDGKYPIQQAEHIVILNWNDDVPSVLRQLSVGKELSGNKFYRRPVAILGDAPKSKMDLAVLQALKGRETMNVYTRQGSPGQVKDQQMVMVKDAHSVIVMRPPGDDKTSRPLYMSSVMALSSQIGGKVVGEKGTVHSLVLQQEDADLVDCLNRLRGGLGAPIASNKKIFSATYINRLTALSAVQPGLVEMYQEILCPRASTLMLKKMPPCWVGNTWRQGRRKLGTGIPCGFVRNGVTNLDPKEDDVMQLGDRVILVSSKLRHEDKVESSTIVFKLFEDSATKAAEWRAHDVVQPKMRMQTEPVNIIVIDNDFEDSGLIQEFMSVVPPKSTITYVVSRKPSALSIPKSKNGSKVNVIVNSKPTSSKALLEAGIADATSLVFGGLRTMPRTDADAYLASSILQIQDAVISSGRSGAPYVIAPMHKSGSRSTIEAWLKSLYETAEVRGLKKDNIIHRMGLFQQDDILAGVMVQTAADPSFVSIVQELMTVDAGQEIYLRAPQLFSIPEGTPIMFSDILEATRHYGETAIGISFADGSFIAAPRPKFPVNLQKGDKIAVIGADFVFSGLPSTPRSK